MKTKYIFLIMYHNITDHISPLNKITFGFPSPKHLTIISESLLHLAPAYLSDFIFSFLLLPSQQSPLCSSKTEAQVFLTSMPLNQLVGLHRMLSPDLRWQFLSILHITQDKFCSTLFTIAMAWKQHKCPSTGEWIKKMWYICIKEYYSAIKRNEIRSFVERCGWS